MIKKKIIIIEGIVVVSVIFILVGVVMPRFKGMPNEVSVTKSKAEIKILQTALESFYINQSPNAYPATSNSVLETYLSVASPLIVEFPLYDPFRFPEVEYSYILSLNGLYYVVFSYGLDGEADITGVSARGVLEGIEDDDIYATNGTGF